VHDEGDQGPHRRLAGLIEATVPPGSGPTAHAHSAEDEAFYILVTKTSTPKASWLPRCWDPV